MTLGPVPKSPTSVVPAKAGTHPRWGAFSDAGKQSIPLSIHIRWRDLVVGESLLGYGAYVSIGYPQSTRRGSPQRRSGPSIAVHGAPSPPGLAGKEMLN